MPTKLPAKRTKKPETPWKPAARQVSRIVGETKVLNPIGPEALPARRRKPVNEKVAHSEDSVERLLKEWLRLNEKIGKALNGNPTPDAPPATTPTCSKRVPFRATKKMPVKEKAEKKPPRVLTPRHPREVQKNIARLEFKPEIKNGKLYFSCPCCHFPTTVFAHYAGKQTRCSRCLSAIKAPDPENGRAGRNLEQTVESMLHPDRFVAVIPRRRSLWTVVPMPPLHVALGAVGALALTLFIGVGNFIGSKGQIAEGPQKEGRFVTSREFFELSPDLGKKKIVTPPADHRARAANVVEQFVASDSTAARRQFVKDARSISTHLGNYYGKTQILGERVVSTSPLSYYIDNGETIPVTEVITLDADQAQRVYMVEHRPDRDYIDWEASVGYNPRTLSAVIAPMTNDGKTTPKEKPLRLLANIDNYYNFEFNNESDLLCVRLADPNEPGVYAFGYIERSHPHAKALARYLARTDSWSPRPLTIGVRTLAGSAKTRQLEIVNFRGSHWRSEATAEDKLRVVAQN
ncbi:MAG: hypothetical protein AAGA58_11630 [Verrucomicrobiota bacterium]